MESTELRVNNRYTRNPLSIDSCLNSTKDKHMNSEMRYTHVVNFKDMVGFKEIGNIKDRYKIGQVLGEGSFGQVRIAMHRQANVKCAIKIIKKEKISQHKILLDLMQNELKVLETAAHPNIMRIYELLHDQNFYFIVSEYIRYGELYDFIVEKGKVSEKDVQKLVY